ncbi:MAG: acyl-CoA dehydrogenase, partial [Deltaproteobacteria bacterium]|nr:acyl-CoA dehydrogenase [Deltaproteobacteria bacterium]
NEIVLDDVRVTRADLLGAAGDGFDVANDMFGVARLGISAIALGGLRRCVQLAHRFASRREISTGSLLGNAHTREVLASMIASVAAAESLLQYTAARCDGLAPPAHLAAICKAVVPELLWQAADRTTQLLGGRGYIESNGLPQLVRDARLLRIFEGPTETLEMHLGSAVLGNMVEIFDGASEARTRVEAWTRKLSAALEDTRGDARIAATQHAKLAVGQLSAWGLLAAVVEQRGDDPLSQLAKRWAFAQLESRAAALASPLVADVDVVERAIADYRDVIGDIEQTLPGEDHALDPMLRRS